MKKFVIFSILLILIIGTLSILSYDSDIENNELVTSHPIEEVVVPELLESHHAMNLKWNKNTRTATIDKVDGCGMIYKKNTHSMNPTIAEGNWICWENYDNFKEHSILQVGDILIFDYYGYSIVHRLVYIDGDNYYMQGDNNDNQEVIKEENINGVVKSINLK